MTRFANAGARARMYAAAEEQEAAVRAQELAEWESYSPERRQAMIDRNLVPDWLREHHLQATRPAVMPNMRAMNGIPVGMPQGTKGPAPDPYSPQPKAPPTGPVVAPTPGFNPTPSQPQGPAAPVLPAGNQPPTQPVVPTTTANPTTPSPTDTAGPALTKPTGKDPSAAKPLAAGGTKDARKSPVMPNFRSRPATWRWK